MAHLRIPECCKDVPPDMRYWANIELVYQKEQAGWCVPECHKEDYGKYDLVLMVHKDYKPKAKLKAVR